MATSRSCSPRGRGEAREVGRIHASVAAEVARTGELVSPPAVVLSGGEVAVTVAGDGRGGPNQELALAASIDLALDGTDAVLASVDTYGIDGPGSVAGAIVEGETVDGGDPADVEAARAALDRNDAVAFLAGRDALLEPGRTGTNVNDLRVIVVEESSVEGS